MDRYKVIPTFEEYSENYEMYDEVCQRTTEIMKELISEESTEKSHQIRIAPNKEFASDVLDFDELEAGNHTIDINHDMLLVPQHLIEKYDDLCQMQECPTSEIQEMLGEDSIYIIEVSMEIQYDAEEWIETNPEQRSIPTADLPNPPDYDRDKPEIEVLDCMIGCGVITKEEIIDNIDDGLLSRFNESEQDQIIDLVLDQLLA